MLTLTEFVVNHQSQVKLVMPEPYFATDLFNLIQQNQNEMGQWLPWSNNLTTPNDEAHFLQMSKEDLVMGKNASYVILVDAQPAGMIDLHNLNSDNHSGEIGYWLGEKFQGQGIMTEAVKHFIGAIQEELGLHKINILVDVDNDKSRAVPQRLGFEHEAQLKDEIYHNQQYHDADLYSKIVD